MNFLVINWISSRYKPTYSYLYGSVFNRYSALKALYGPRQANLVLIAYASREGSGEPAHPRSLARTFAARSYKKWVKRNLQTESQISGSSEWLGMRIWNLSWRNARRHEFAWLGPYNLCILLLQRSKYFTLCAGLNQHWYLCSNAELKSELQAKRQCIPSLLQSKDCP